MEDEYDPDYMVMDDPEPDVENNWDDPVDEHNAGIDFESMIYEVDQNLKDLKDSNESYLEAITKYEQIVESERDNMPDGEGKYSYKCYEKICTIYLKLKDFDNFSKNFENLFKIYHKIDDVDKQDSINGICHELHDLRDEEFSLNVYRKMIDTLMEKEIEREVLNTGVLYTKTLFSLGKIEELGEAINEILGYLESNIRNEDELTKSIRLELLVLKIQYCNINKNAKESKRLYIEASKLNQNKIIMDTRLSAIINEEGGKLFMRQKDYDKSLERFKEAFYNYQESGNIRAKVLLKYSILTSIMSRNRNNIVSRDEARHYSGDLQLQAMLDLQSAYEDNDINLINHIWKEKISKIEDDPFILENLNDILHSIRYNYICSKLKAYRVCNFETLEKELNIERGYLSSLLFEIVLNGSLDAKINLVRNNIEVVEIQGKEESHIKNFKNWVGYLYNQ